jgi:hypothetical protein
MPSPPGIQTPSKLDLVGTLAIYQNATYQLPITLTDPGGAIDLTGCTIEADIVRPADGTLLGTFVTLITSAVQGKFSLTLTPAAALALPVGRWAYDLYITNASGQRSYWLTGIAEVVLTYSR